MLHHVCHLEMVGQRVKIKDKDGEMRLVESYSGRYCPRCKDQKLKGGCCVHRDYNAAYNICSLTENLLSGDSPLGTFGGESIRSFSLFFPWRVPAAIVRMTPSHEYLTNITWDTH
ncbi:hypothetical protein H632_c89p4 [Helicosporidium sp. ATCC 50920]|nr:hypothetical protein H632_c89p4 [Helicosporidium sp. ATCC 50920]|eukprot:KDD76844.1 hypothetical protein H632_c89p4 [Helicosporidium sp. ATCC 50920]